MNKYDVHSFSAEEDSLLSSINFSEYDSGKIKEDKEDKDKKEENDHEDSSNSDVGTCQYCECSFVKNRKLQIYCSHSCKENARYYRRRLNNHKSKKKNNPVLLESSTLEDATVKHSLPKLKKEKEKKGIDTKKSQKKQKTISENTPFSLQFSIKPKSMKCINASRSRLSDCVCLHPIIHKKAKKSFPAKQPFVKDVTLLEITEEERWRNFGKEHPFYIPPDII